MAEEVKVVESKEQVALLGQIAADLKMQNRLLEKVNAGQAEEIQKEDMYAKMFDEAEKAEQARQAETNSDNRASIRERIKSGKKVSGMVPVEVEKEIIKNGYYIR